jgi:hypothetical protein
MRMTTLHFAPSRAIPRHFAHEIKGMTPSVVNDASVMKEERDEEPLRADSQMTIAAHQPAPSAQERVLSSQRARRCELRDGDTRDDSEHLEDSDENKRDWRRRAERRSAWNVGPWW